MRTLLVLRTPALLPIVQTFEDVFSHIRNRQGELQAMNPGSGMRSLDGALPQSRDSLDQMRRSGGTSKVYTHGFRSELLITLDKIPTRSRASRPRPF
jgi:hypothetical protein